MEINRGYDYVILEGEAVMISQLSLKKEVMTILAAGIILSLSGIGCRQRSPRIYNVAYSWSRTAGQEQNFDPSQDPLYSDSSDNWQTDDSAEYNEYSTYESVALQEGQGSDPTNIYHIGPGDVLLIRVSQMLDLKREEIIKAEVDRAGMIYLPLLQHVPVAGLTNEQLREELTMRLAREFIRHPKVDVSITDYRSKEVMVMGTVRRPGPLALRSDCATLRDVISYAGGIANFAGPNVEILRGAYNPISGNTGSITARSSTEITNQNYHTREIVPIARLFDETEEQVNPVIFPGDVVKIASASEGYIYISGEVEQPGAKPFRRPLNILQAVTCAGGTTNIAAEKKCKIVRRNPEGNEKVIMVNIEHVRAGKQENLMLAQNDIIMIPTDPLKKFFDDIDDLIKRGVNTGVNVTYDAGTEMGIPAGGQ